MSRWPMLACRPVSAKVMCQSWMSLESNWIPAALGEDEVVGQRLVVGEEVALHQVAPVAQAQQEVALAVVRVVAHHVPEDRPVADDGHRLGNGLAVPRQP